MIIWGKNMNKKILIGSIIAVTVLIGVSFTSVVGYRSGASDVKASPLFNIRTSRAIDEESEELSCEYVGKGEDVDLIISPGDNELKLIRKLIEKIQSMDEETFTKFMNHIIENLDKINKTDIGNTQEIIEAIYKLRTNSEDYEIKSIPAQITGMFWECTWKENYWYPGCILFSLIDAIIYYFIFLPIWFITWIFRLNTIGPKITFCTCNLLCGL